MPEPYTIRHGSWSPDLQNVGVQLPYSIAPVELPSADCNNVYFQDGAFRCLPGPAPFAGAIGGVEAVLSALTYYDQVANQEVLFAATADGISALIDGVWVPLTLFGLAGSTISVAAPSFSIVAAMGGVVGPGQAASLKLALKLGAPTAKGQLYNGSMVAGQSAGGNEIGFVSGSFGSLTPTVDMNGHTIGELISSVIARGTEYQVKLSVQATVTQSYFSALVNHTLGITLASAAAFFSSSGGSSTWTWSAQTYVMNLSSGIKYAISLKY